ncbi:2,5-diamino-6-(ribosylamino)-4(3H)-pyrimidinone 5'-phosphate reductase [Saxophila tyrrhenica]|uniref:2,5-diamino-6-ribosylamino-4(3H)-pyrimidinone 5'-phosphate reductase n=1 Tax=Saxophila tyrrhenica TaxID=1690608 RepID=A0AAV9P049_9PEZI|nr:2,5-diamino-6-(ribosylamino)-4(3H)-pyrimidinone 5'-phosphate reductase [Saxophila tyrrhenica]
MSDIDQLSTEDEAFLRPYLPDDDAISKKERPFVTLTYACSLDGMISLSPGVRTTLSGPETKSMTHYLRAHHEAILVGVGTAIADDPSLNCRYSRSSSCPPQGLRPVVLDPTMRWDVAGSKATALASEGKGKAPWVVHATSVLDQNPEVAEQAKRLFVGTDGLCDEHSGDRTASISRLEWRSILKALYQKGIRSIMIEGGATVINDLLLQPELVDSVVVTIAPTWLGEGGVTVTPAQQTRDGVRVNAARLKETSWRQFGQDAVLCGRLE